MQLKQFLNFFSEKDAQVSIYHISWEKDFGFSCQIDEECARGLAGTFLELMISYHLFLGS